MITGPPLPFPAKHELTFLVLLAPFSRSTHRSARVRKKPGLSWNWAPARLMKRLKLTLYERKTCVCLLPESTFDLLGYTIGRCYSPKTGRAYLGTRPSRKAVRKVVRAISSSSRRHGLQ